MEIWKDVVGYEGKYKVSNMGRVYSLNKEKYMRCCNDKRGYARLILRKDNKSYGNLVHRLVATAFLPNPSNYKEINHKDENPSNNTVDNLEWCTKKYNNNYGTKIERQVKNKNYRQIADKQSIKVLQYDRDGNLLMTWKSARECKKKSGFDNSVIAKCCRGELNTAYGFKWEYYYGSNIC